MSVDFCDYFWGEKNNGFDVLYQNSKQGQITCKELSDFIKERANAEENYGKSLLKLSCRINNSGVTSSFSPIWAILRFATEKTASIHINLFGKFMELLKDVSRFMDELHKRQKTVKEEESPTMEIVHIIQQLTISAHKAKDLYRSRILELRKAQESNMAPKDLEKIENKVKRATEDYRAIIEKYAGIRSDFERKMTISCRHFQELEENYLCQMKEFVENYVQVIEAGQILSHSLIADINQKVNEKTILQLLEDFTSSKQTGLEKPPTIEFEECEIMPESQREITSDSVSENCVKKTEGPAVATNCSGATKLAAISRNKRISLMKTTKKKDSDKNVKEDGFEACPEVDEEGFSVRPPGMDTRTVRASVSSSDDGSDSDDSMPTRFHVKIKPLDQLEPISASVDELRHMVSGLMLTSGGSASQRGSPDISGDGQRMRRSQSQQLAVSGHVPVLPCGVGDVSESTDAVQPLEHTYTRPTLPPKHHANHQSDLAKNSSLPSLSSVLLPRPPSRRSYDGCGSGTMPGRMSPLARPLRTSPGRSDAALSAQNRSNPVVGGSRGPSPLTLSSGDSIPLAVAFQEVVHAYFHGSDASRCQVRITGDVMVSFPAGMVQVLTRAAGSALARAPAPLVFTLKHTTPLDALIPNHHLVTETARQPLINSVTFQFRMDNLAQLLRAQTEKNPTASYFNVDIVKYQVGVGDGDSSVPLHLLAHWKCETTHTDFKLEYRLGVSSSLRSLAVAVPVEGGVGAMRSQPEARWLADSSRAVWQLNDVGAGSGAPAGAGTLKARFDLTQGPGAPTTVAAQFCCEGATLSGAKFELVAPGYRLSLVKHRFVSGKYLCDSDFVDSGDRYAAPRCDE